MRFPLLTVAFAAALLVVGIATEATATTTAVPKLRGTIGPGYTISLKNAAGKRVKSLRHGKYTFIVRDKAGIHNFTLKGPGGQEQDDHRHRLRRHEDGAGEAQGGEVQVLLHRSPHYHRDVQSHLNGVGRGSARV